MATMNADVAVVDRDSDRVERMLLYGARNPTAGERFDHVLEAAGAPGSVELACGRAAPGGTVVVVGLTGKGTDDVPIDAVVINEQTLTGSLGSPGVWPDAIGLIASAAVRPSQLVTHVFDLIDFADAYALLRRGQRGTGKVLIAPNGAQHPATGGLAKVTTRTGAAR